MSHPKSSVVAVRQPAIPEDDPVWQAVMNAPIDDEPLTDEERAAMAAGAAGPFVDTATVLAEIRKRAEAEGAAAEFDAIRERRAREASRHR